MYKPIPINMANVNLSEELIALTENLAESTHDVWAAGWIVKDWSHGIIRDEKKETSYMVPYSELFESEKEYGAVRQHCMQLV